MTIDSTESNTERLRFQKAAEGFAECETCVDGMNPVYRCPTCLQTFCNGCTDLDAWLEDLHKVCPHCGWIQDP